MTSEFIIDYVSRKIFPSFWDALYIQSGKDTTPDISQSVSKSVSCILTPACHKIHFPASGRDEIRKLEKGPREDPPRNPLLLLFSQRGEYKRYSLHLPGITFMESAANEGKYFYAPTLLFLFSVVNCASILVSDIKVLSDHFVPVNVFLIYKEQIRIYYYYKYKFNL